MIFKFGVLFFIICGTLGIASLLYLFMNFIVIIYYQWCILGTSEQILYPDLWRYINEGYYYLHGSLCWLLGASVDYSDGFVGCMRALMVNGVVQDLRGKVDSGEVTYGVSSGQWEPWRQLTPPMQPLQSERQIKLNVYRIC